MSFCINHAGKSVLFDTSEIKNRYLQECAEKALHRLFGYFFPADGKEVEMTFVFTDHIEDFFIDGPETIKSEGAMINPTQIFMAGHGNQFGYEYRDGVLRKVYYSLYVPSKWQNNKHKAVSREFISAVESQIYSFYTRGYLNSLQQLNICKGWSFLHACSFCINGNAYVVTATPGAGKSSLLLSMCFNPNVDLDFISDDFSLVDERTHAHQIGRAMAIKSHQIQYFPGLKDKLQNMSALQRLQWFLLKQKGLKRLAAPAELFGDRIVTDKPVKKIFYLTNHGKETFEHEPFTVEEFARLNANMLFSELYLGMEIFNRALILPGNKNMNNVGELIEGTRRNLVEIFKHTPCTLIKVPFRSDPRKLLQYLLDNKLIG
jgi:hypothetical protein